ncbi:MAG: hypothetical protein ACFB10_14540 [Salibacteraceae bacterium]
MPKFSYAICLSLLTLALLACQTEIPPPPQAEAAPEKIVVKGPWMGMQPTETPKLLAPQLLASPIREYNAAFSPDGTSFYYTLNYPGQGVIVETQLQEDNTWAAPVVAPFSGKWSEYDPLFSPDGKFLYFSSERPTPDDPQNTKSNIWRLTKEGNSWGAPEYVSLGTTGNYHSSLDEDGHLYFNRWSDGDLYKASPEASGYSVEKIPGWPEASQGEGDPFIGPQGDYLIFRGYENTLGRGDLYISYRTPQGWTPAINLGVPINSPAQEMCPYVTSDGQFFLFASGRKQTPYQPQPGAEIDPIVAKNISFDNGWENLYYVSADFIETLRPKNEVKSQ